MNEWMNKWRKIYEWRLTISKQNNVYSQRQVLPQAKNTITPGQHDPQKLTRKTQNGNIGIHNVTYILHKRFGNNRTYIITILQVYTQTRARTHTHTEVYLISGVFLKSFFRTSEVHFCFFCFFLMLVVRAFSLVSFHLISKYRKRGICFSSTLVEICCYQIAAVCPL